MNMFNLMSEMSDLLLLTANKIEGVTNVPATEVAHAVAASASHEGSSMTHKMMLLMLQVAILIFAAQLGGKIAVKLKMPGVLGELGAGIVVGPYLLGGIDLPAIGKVFPIVGDMAVSPELYGFATLASIILLFMSGLETDLRMFLKYSVAGSVVGISGVVCSMFLGMAMGPIIIHLMDPSLVTEFLGLSVKPGQTISYTHPLSLFFGVLCVATSVGITARILSIKKKMDSSEGVTILAGAVIDDVLGIVCLAVVMGIVDANKSGEHLDAMRICIITLKAVSVWLVFSVLGLIFAQRISNALKKYHHQTVMVAAAIGLTLILAAIFESAGLAMIIGAYVMGLCLSKTDLKFPLMKHLHGFYEFFVPVFFAVMGALVDVTCLKDPMVIKFGLIYAALAIVAKLVGCALPCFGLNFNWKGALRVGAGMIPRGEVALIIAGLGVSKGVLDSNTFGIAIIMTLLTTVVAPPILNLLLDIPGRGTKKEDVKDEDQVQTTFNFPNSLIKEMVVGNLRQTFINEGFFVVITDVEEEVYQMRKNEIAFSMDAEPDSIIFTSTKTQVPFIKMAVYETLIDFHQSVADLKKLNAPEEMRQEVATAVFDSDTTGLDVNTLLSAINRDCIRLHLNHLKTKEEVLRYLVDVMGDAGVVKNRDELYTLLVDRERLISTGMQNGIALPHCHSDEVEKVQIAIAVCPQGVEFDSLDGKSSKLIILLVSPNQRAKDHLQTLAMLGSIVMKENFVDSVVAANNTPEVYNLFQQNLS